MRIEKDILRVLTYFDIFNYPLEAAEIRQFLPRQIDSLQFTNALDQLCTTQQAYRINEYFALKNDPAIVMKRKKDNARAEQLLRTASNISSFLYQFPFVRAVGISGSLSKKVADENADIDFFIITKANKLWLSRTFMHLFKKLTFLVGRQHWFCMNYYIDEDFLQIPEKNVFTATEIVTLLPVCGNGTLKKFFDANEWATMQFPNFPLSANSLRPSGHGIVKRCIEAMFDNRAGEWLDNYLMRLTSKRWAVKEERGDRNIKGNRMGLRVGKHFSKPNPVYFQQKVLFEYERRVKLIEADLLATG